MTLKLVNLSAGYDRHPAVHHVSGMFADGGMTAVIGPNGGGKSTLLKAMIGLLKPMSGHIELQNCAAHDLAYLPQISEIDRSFPITVSEAVGLGHWPRRGPFRSFTTEDRKAVQIALAQVGMEAYAERPIAALSTGQWQRIMFARLIVQNARVVMLDEPFSAIDGRTTHDLLHVLESWCREGRTVIVVMHDMEAVRSHFPQALLLARELIGWGKTSDVLADANMAKAAMLAAHWSEEAEACHREEIKMRHRA